MSPSRTCRFLSSLKAEFHQRAAEMRPEGRIAPAQADFVSACRIEQVALLDTVFHHFQFPVRPRAYGYGQPPRLLEDWAFGVIYRGDVIHIKPTALGVNPVQFRTRKSFAEVIRLGLLSGHAWELARPAIVARWASRPTVIPPRRAVLRVKGATAGPATGALGRRAAGGSTKSDPVCASRPY